MQSTSRSVASTLNTVHQAAQRSWPVTASYVAAFFDGVVVTMDTVTPLGYSGHLPGCQSSMVRVHSDIAGHDLCLPVCLSVGVHVCLCQ